MIVDLIYPIGSIYMSVNSTSPASLFGGTWTQLQNRFLLGAGSSYSAGATGGASTHVLEVSEMPSHSHGLYYAWSGGGSYAVNRVRLMYVDSGTSQWVRDGSTIAMYSVGENTAHNNMPPYLVVYMWKRVS